MEGRIEGRNEERWAGSNTERRNGRKRKEKPQGMKQMTEGE
jgi:hypothetical protein